MNSNQTTDWPARHAAIVAADGEEWDRLSERFHADWQHVYCAAFIEIAMERGWTREDAESWPDNIMDDALLSADAHGYCPRRTAEADVIACEMECANG